METELGEVHRNYLKTISKPHNWMVLVNIDLVFAMTTTNSQYDCVVVSLLSDSVNCNMLSWSYQIDMSHVCKDTLQQYYTYVKVK